MNVSLHLYEEADRLQKKGFTFTEIAAALGVGRETIVDVLYYDVVNRVREHTASGRCPAQQETTNGL